MLDSPASLRFLSASLVLAVDAREEAEWEAPFAVILLAAPADDTGGATLGALERGWTGRVRLDADG